MPQHFAGHSEAPRTIPTATKGRMISDNEAGFLSLFPWDHGVIGERTPPSWGEPSIPLTWPLPTEECTLLDAGGRGCKP